VSGILYALIRKAAKLRPTLGLETLLASTLTIGTGGSAGPEAPIAVIGSSVGSIIGAAAGISRRNLPTLIGCGAAAAISAIFFAPIAGVLFAMEVMLRDFSVRTFTPVVVSSVVATVMYQTITASGGGGLFAMPAAAAAYHFTFAEMPYYILLGLVCGVLAILLTRGMVWVEHAFDRLTPRVSRGFHPAIGAGLSGVCGVILILLFRHDAYLGGAAGRFALDSYVPIFAGGYPTIHRTLDPAWYSGITVAGGQFAVLSLAFLAVLCFLKIAATSLTLGGGGSGGVFAPALFIGATGGGAVGVVLRHFSPAVDPSSYALVGMGAVLAAAIQAPLMSIILLFELTRNYQVMLPAMLGAVTATLIQQLIVKESIYTLPLRDEGIGLGAPTGISALRRISVEEVPLATAEPVEPGDPAANLIRQGQPRAARDMPVIDRHGKYLGMLTLDDIRTMMLAPDSVSLLLAGDLVRSGVPPLSPSDTLDTAFEAFSRHEVDYLPVFGAAGGRKELKGLLSRAELMRRYHLELTS
jgi:CIC family chloride channel protein